MASAERVFLDTNVLLDVLCEREPFLASSASVWALAEAGQIAGVVSAVSFTNIYYIVNRLGGRSKARTSLQLLTAAFSAAQCDQDVIQKAIAAEMRDFEDAVQYFTAVKAGAAVLLTRNASHFPSVPMRVMSPTEYLRIRAAR